MKVTNFAMSAESFKFLGKILQSAAKRCEPVDGCHLLISNESEIRSFNHKE